MPSLRSPLTGQPPLPAELSEAFRPQVLVVDSDESARLVLRAALLRTGFEPISAASSHQALQLIAPGRPVPSAAVIETELSGDDGLYLCGQLRADLRTAELPILLLSRNRSGYQAELAESAGADDCFIKPTFARDVASWLQLKSASREGGSYFVHSAHLPLASLLRALLSGTRAGRIDVWGGRGNIAFRRGRVIDAQLEARSGTDVLLKLLELADGEYTVTYGPSLQRESFSLDLRDLTQQVFPHVRRWRSAVDEGMPLGARLAVDFETLARVLSSMPDEMNRLLRLFDGRRTVRDVVLECPLNEVTTLRAVTRLYSQGVLMPAPEPTAAGLRPPPPGWSDWSPSSGMVTRPFVDFDGASFERPPPIQLDPELERQLEAFAIAPQIEPADPAPVLELTEELEQPLELEVARTLQAAETAQSEPIPLTQVKPPQPSTPRYLSPGVPVGRLTLKRAAMEGIAEAVEFKFFNTEKRTSPSGFWNTLAVVAGAAAVTLGIALVIERPGPIFSMFEAEAKPKRIIELAPLELAPHAEPSGIVLESNTAYSEALRTGRTLYEQSRPRQAARYLEQAVALEPTRAAAWVLLGLARFDADQLQAAEHAARKALELEPGNGRALLLLASIAYDQGRAPQGNAALEKYLALEPNGPFAKEARALLDQHRP